MSEIAARWAEEYAAAEPARLIEDCDHLLAGDARWPVERVRALASRLGEFSRGFSTLRALTVCRAGLLVYPGDRWLLHRQGLLLANTGALRSSLGIASRLCSLSDLTRYEASEFFGLRGRVLKSLAQSTTGQSRRHYLAESLAAYERGLELSGSWYNGVNAATMAVLVGASERAAHLATATRALLEQDPPGGAPDFWRLASRGELALVLGDRREASERYGEAVAAAREGDGAAHKRVGRLVSARRNARLLVQHMDGSTGWADETIRVPRVAMLVGHMIDREDRPIPRFPPEAEADVGARIRYLLELHEVDLGVASAACGADTMLHEAVASRGGASLVVLPFSEELFRRTSVRLREDGSWEERFGRVLSNAWEIVHATREVTLHDFSYFEYCQRLVTGLAVLEAAAREDPPLALAVWDGAGAGDGPYGTGTAVRQWAAAGYDVIPIPPLAGRDGDRHPPAAIPKPVALPRLGGPSSVSARFGAIISCRLATPSSGAAGERAEALGELYGALNECIVDCGIGNVGVAWTWTHWAPSENGCRIVFASARAAAIVAHQLHIRLAARVGAVEAARFSRGVSVSLHAGLVFEVHDPVSVSAASSSVIVVSDEADEDPTSGLDHALSQLPPSLRSALVMTSLEGRSYEEAAELQATTVGALKLRVHRARALLQLFPDTVTTTREFAACLAAERVPDFTCELIESWARGSAGHRERPRYALVARQDGAALPESPRDAAAPAVVLASVPRSAGQFAPLRAIFQRELAGRASELSSSGVVSFVSREIERLLELALSDSRAVDVVLWWTDGVDSVAPVLASTGSYGHDGGVLQKLAADALASGVRIVQRGQGADRGAEVDPVTEPPVGADALMLAQPVWLVGEPRGVVTCVLRGEGELDSAMGLTETIARIAGQLIEKELQESIFGGGW